MKMKSIIIFLASELKPWSWFNFTSIAERTCRDAKNLLWKIRSMTCRNVKNNWNWYFNLKLVFNSIDQIQFVILLKGNVDNAFFTSYVLSSSNVSQSFAHPDFAGIEKRAKTEINIPNGCLDAYEVKVNIDIFNYQEKVKLISKF